MRTQIFNKDNLPEQISVGKANNLIGKKFGRLLVLYRCNPPERIKNKSQTYWVCKCDCGNYIQARTGALITNGLQSCGCLHSEKAREILKEYQDSSSPWNKQDLSNQRFGKLIALENFSRNNKSFWHCKCDCGCSKDVETYNLTHHLIFDCGCQRLSVGEYAIKRFLDKRGISYRQEFSFDDLKDKCKLRFDFAIFDNTQLKCLIEYQGEQHFYESNRWFSKNMQEHDKVKRKYCNKNKIPLYEILYNENIEDRLEQIFGKKEMKNNLFSH